MDLGLEGAAAVVSGGSKGMGRAAAECLAADRCRVAVLGRGQAALDETVAELRAAGSPDPVGYSVDLTDAEQVATVFAAIGARWGSLNVLVNAAGPLGSTGTIEDLDDANWVRAFDEGTMSAVRCVRGALPWMRQAEWARIVNVAAHSVKRQSPSLIAYTAAKAAMTSMSKNLARTLGPEGILVNTVSPGSIMSSGLRGYLQRVADRFGIDPENPRDAHRVIAEEFGHPVDLERAGLPDEVGAVIAFVASRRNSYMTGANINVDGGSDFLKGSDPYPARREEPAVHDHAVNPNIRLVDGGFYASDPHPHLQWMREHAPVYWDEAAQVWGIARYDDVLAIAKDPTSFCNRHGIRPDAPIMPYMIDKDGSEHRKRRALVHKGFTPRRVQEHEPRIRAVAIALIERAKERGRFDFVMDLAAWLPLIVIGDLLGVEPAHHDDLLRWSEAMVLGSGTTDPERLMPAAQAFNDYVDYQRTVIADRRAKPQQQDLVSVLTHAEIDGEKLTDDELLMEALLILIGGDETTRHVMTGGMHQLLLHPEQRRALAADPAKIPIAVEEMLRWVTPIQNMARSATRAIELRGQRIEEGQKLLLLYPSGNRDAAVFPDPFTFDTRRVPNEHIAFGFGTHFCLGASLARLELRVFFEEVLQRMPDLQLVSTEPPPYRASNFICGIESLPVVWES